jgi:hypothetical protein
MKTTKEVTILARYAHKTDGKLNGRVTYLVKSSDGTTKYCTTLIDGKPSGCSCPSRKPCYHMHQLETREQERKAVAEQFATEKAPVWTVELARKGKIVAPKINKPVEQTPVQATPCRKPVLCKSADLSAAGNLNGNRGFSLMR